VSFVQLEDENIEIVRNASTIWTAAGYESHFRSS
jgi:hypothetical protein